MNLPVFISWRYLFSKKSLNVINVISAISVIGILISTGAIIVVLSAFNGIEGLVDSLYSSFDSDLRIEKIHNKTFSSGNFPRKEITSIQGISNITGVIEEITLIKHRDLWVVATIKGVEPNFLAISGLDTMVVEGDAYLKNAVPVNTFTNGIQGQQMDSLNFAIVGAGIRRSLNLTAGAQALDYLSIYGPVRGKKLSGNTDDAFNQDDINIAGIFSVNIDFDNKYVIVPLDFAAQLLSYNKEVTAYEVNCTNQSDIEDIKKQIQNILTDDFSVKSRYEQNELVYKTNAAEKWMTFLILAFILVISTFNIVASLTMLILDKKHDIGILTSLGAKRQTITRIFFLQGLFINLLGGGLGILIGLLICLGQKTYHWVPLEGTIIDHYPVEIQTGDFILVTATVVILGTLSSWLPVNYLINKRLRRK